MKFYSMTSPFVLHNAIDFWPAAKWSPDKLAEILDSRTFTTRFGPKNHVASKILWENESLREDVTVTQLLKWYRGETQREISYDIKDYWAYVDYKYMFEYLDEEHLSAVDWSKFLGTERDGTDSSLWIGTEGAYTPCHYDTYGFNLYAQISGHKRWILFPPDDSKILKPTRIPYEESSVYSSIDILSCPTSLVTSSPYMVTLCPGDLLYVPPYWWHSVQCLDLSLSINTWIPISNDNNILFNESITKTMISIFLQSGILTQKSINPTESEMSPEENLTLLDQLKHQMVESDAGPSCKKPKVENTDNMHDYFLSNFVKLGHSVPKVSYEEMRKTLKNGPLNVIERNKEIDDSDINYGDFVAKMLHPDVVDALKNVLL